MADDLTRKLWDALVESLEELERAEARLDAFANIGLSLGDMGLGPADLAADRYIVERRAARAAGLTPDERARLRAPAPL